jgi:HPP family
MLIRIVAHWGASQRPPLVGVMWMVVLLGILVWLDDPHEGMFLVPPFAATMSILLCLPNVPIAQPFAVVVGSVLGAAIGTVLSMLLGFGPGVAMVAALTALIALPLGLSSTRRRFGDVSRSAASRAMVCSSGRAAIHARCGDFFRGDEPVVEQLAAIPRATSNRKQDLMSPICRQRKERYWNRAIRGRGRGTNPSPLHLLGSH